MKAFIFAAGLGTRLHPLTDKVPKALVNVGPDNCEGPAFRRPLLWWVARRLVAAGADELVINVHHFADKVVDYVHSENDFGVKVSFSDEREMLMDTGGGLLKARTLLECGTESFLVHNVDIISDLDLAEFYSREAGDAVASLAVCDTSSERKLLFDEEMRLKGWKNTLTGEVRGPAASLCDREFREYAFTGIQRISPDIFKCFDAHEEFRGAFGIIDFYLKICSEKPIFGDIHEKMDFLDVGTIEAYEKIGSSGLLGPFPDTCGA